MNRGARREPIFTDPYHCSLFLEHLAKVVKRFQLEVHAYALMPNHYHLLVRSVRGNLSVGMKELNGPYTQELNNRYGWDGPVFRGRFKNQVISESEHLRIVIPYIHLNPVHARLVMSPDQALWTSYAAYTGQEVLPPDWLTTETVLSLYVTRENLVAETMGYHTGEIPWPSDFDLRKGVFRSWSPEIPRTAWEKAVWKEQQVDYVRELVGIITGANWEEVRQPATGRGGNPARRFAIWLLGTRTTLTRREIGEAVCANSNQVSLVLSRLRRRGLPEPLESWMHRTKVWTDWEEK